MKNIFPKSSSSNFVTTSFSLALVPALALIFSRAAFAVDSAPPPTNSLVSLSQTNALLTNLITIVERGPGFRTIQVSSGSTNNTDGGNLRSRHYKQLQTGMHVLRGTNWVETDPAFTLVTGAAIATNTAHSLRLASNPVVQN